MASDVVPRATHAPHAAAELSTFREGSLHAALKARYSELLGNAPVEAPVDGFVVDVVGRSELVEIQTAAFASVRLKLERLVESRRVVLVHPLPAEKWIVVVDEQGAVVRRRRSPRRALPLDLFDELVHIPALLTHPNFRIEVVYTSEEEVRGPLPAGCRRRHPRTWRRLDRRLLRVITTCEIDCPRDLLSLLPAGLADTFTTADVVAASGRSKRLAMRAVYCLARLGVVRAAGRRGRHVVYERC